MTEALGGRGHQQHGDVGNRAVIADARQATDAGLLERDAQEPAENPLHRGAAIVIALELFGAIRNLIPEGGGQAAEIIAALLLAELGMVGRAEQQVPASAIMQGAPILEVSVAFDTHAAGAVHGKVGGAEHLVPLAAETGWVLCPAGISGNVGLSFEALENIAKDVLRVVFGVTTNRFGVQPQRGGCHGEQGNGGGHFCHGVGMSDFPQGQFSLQVRQRMIAITPKIVDLAFLRKGIMNAHAQTRLRVALGRSGFVEAAGAQASLEVVFPDPTGNGTGIKAQVPGCQHAGLEQVSGQLDADMFQHAMRRIGEEGTQPFQAGRWLIGIKSQGRQEGGTFQ